MTDEQALRLESKLDQIIEALPTINALDRLLVRRSNVNERLGLNKNTLSGKDAFEPLGERKTYIEIGEIVAVKSRKSARKSKR